MEKHEWAVILIKEYKKGLKDLNLIKKEIESKSNSDALVDKRIVNSMISEMKLSMKMINRYVK